MFFYISCFLVYTMHLCYSLLFYMSYCSLFDIKIYTIYFSYCIVDCISSDIKCSMFVQNISLFALFITCYVYVVFVFTIFFLILYVFVHIIACIENYVLLTFILDDSNFVVFCCCFSYHLYIYIYIYFCIFILSWYVFICMCFAHYICISSLIYYIVLFSKHISYIIRFQTIIYSSNISYIMYCLFDYMFLLLC